MAKITYIEFNGKQHVVIVKSGLSIMEGAVKNGVPGIVAECGGSCSCGTCHVYVDKAWFEKTRPPSNLEKSILDCVNNVEPNSRLSCQIEVTDALDGLILHTPESQY